MSKIKVILTFAIFMLSLMACAALNPIAPTAEPEPAYSPTKSTVLTEASVPRVSIEEAKAALSSDAAIIIDVRSQEAYAVSHIRGARNIQLGEFETNITGIDIAKDQWIITYCT